ncbi:MAG: AEC family transporter [Clostridiaceae bacterium]
MVLIDALGSVFSIVIMVLLGYFFTAKKWFNQETANLFSILVLNISLPPLMFYNIISNFDRSKLSHLGNGLIIPILSIALCYVIGVMVSRLLRIEEGRRGTFVTMFFTSNTIFVGLPVNLALFGEASVPYVLIYYFANTLFYWTIGVYSISKDGVKKGIVKIFSISTLKRVFSPPLLGFLAAIVFIALNIHVPEFILDSCRYIGDLTTPLSMFYIGITIHSVKLSRIKIDKDLIGINFGRFIISPLLVFFLVSYFPVDLLMKKVFVIQAAMPVVTSTAIVAKVYNADDQYAAVMMVLTTIASIFFIPIYMLILN